MRRVADGQQSTRSRAIEPDRNREARADDIQRPGLPDGVRVEHQRHPGPAHSGSTAPLAAVVSDHADQAESDDPCEIGWAGQFQARRRQGLQAVLHAQLACTRAHRGFDLGRRRGFIVGWRANTTVGVLIVASVSRVMRRWFRASSRRRTRGARCSWSVSSRMATLRDGVRSSRLKPTSACFREIVPVDEANGLETLLHMWRHLPRPVVEPGDQPFGVHPRQDQFIHAPLPAWVVGEVSAHARPTLGAARSEDNERAGKWLAAYQCRPEATAPSEVMLEAPLHRA